MKGNGQRRPEEIQAEIERTRSDLDETLSAIERRLTPGELVDQGLDYLHQSGVKEYFVNLGGAAKDNPMPLALAGIGLAWLMASGSRSARSYASEGYSTTSDYASQAKDKISQATQSLSQTAQSVRDKTSQLTGQVSGTARQLSDTARQQAERMRGSVDYIVNEQPLALGAIGLAIGAILGAMAPRTRQEDQVMGDAAERFREDVKETGREQLDKAKQAAKDVSKESSKDLSSQAGPRPSQQEKEDRASEKRAASGEPGKGTSWSPTAPEARHTEPVITPNVPPATRR